jgi:alcohol dehydrogenase
MRLGADVAIEAAGTPATFELAVKLARPGGRIASIGVHGQPATLHLEQQWTGDITITTSLVDVLGKPADSGALKVVLTRDKDQDTREEDENW